MFGSANRVSRSASYVAAVVVDVVFFVVIGSRLGYESWESVVGVSPSSPNPGPIQDQIIVIFHTSFQAWVSKIPGSLKSIPVFRPGVGRTYVIISQIRKPTHIRFLKFYSFEFAYYSSFLIHLKLKGQITGQIQRRRSPCACMDLIGRLVGVGPVYMLSMLSTLAEYILN